VLHKISSGIYGLDRLLDGGIGKNSISLVAGSSGTGKTIFSLQFILKGLREGNNCLYISLDQNKDQLVSEAVSLGWHEIKEYMEQDRLIFITTRGADFKDFIIEKLPKLVDVYKKSGTTNIRIAIDSITPLLWTIQDKSSQREILSNLFNLYREVGTVLVTAEQYTLIQSEVVPDKELLLPIFLSDYAFVFQFLGLGAEFNKGLRIIKTRGSSHLDGVFPVQIVKGFGLIVEAPPRISKREDTAKDCLAHFKKAIATKIKSAQERRYLETKLEIFGKDWKGESPEGLLNVILSDFE
jgi:KaiC/GvpD/RAD55 family RecA-like ATPase